MFIRSLRIAKTLYTFIHTPAESKEKSLPQTVAQGFNPRMQRQEVDLWESKGSLVYSEFQVSQGYTVRR